MEDKVKQVLIIRKDLKCRTGKYCSQAAHAAMCFLVRRMEVESSWLGSNLLHLSLSDDELEWVKGSFTKITCQVGSLEELNALHEKALAAGLTSCIMTDNGATEFHNVPTVTALAIGPARSSLLDPITGGLKLL